MNLARQIGYVIQDGGLFPHLTAKENILLPAKLQKYTNLQITNRLQFLMDLVHLDKEHLQKYPNELSGGQKQRLSLIRALFLDAPLLLLDEPLGALDPSVRSHLQSELKSIFKKVQKTVILVTHDLSEAAFLGHTINLLDQAELQQHGNFKDLLRSPANDFVKSFIQDQKPDFSLWQ